MDTHKVVQVINGEGGAELLCRVEPGREAESVLTRYLTASQLTLVKVQGKTNFIDLK